MDLILEALKGDQALRYTMVSAASLVCYEYLIMFNNEIHYLWARRISLGGVLLFLCRYLPFASMSEIYLYISTTDLTHSNCITGVRATASIIYIQFLLSALVLYLRTYAVWGGSKKILYLFGFTYAVTIAGGSYSVYLCMKRINSLILLRPNGCIPLLIDDELWIALAILIVSESLAFGLLIVKSVNHARDFKNINHIGPRSILSVMVRDGIGYFACTLVITIANLFVLKRVTPASGLQDILFFMQGAIHNILCSRLFFHIRAAVNDPSTETYPNQMTLSAPAFANMSDGGDSADTHTMIAMTKFGSDF